MQSYIPGLAISAISIGLVTALPAAAAPFIFSTGNPDGKIATASRPADPGAGKIEIESADDFVLTGKAHITGATFTGLLTGGASVGDVGNVRVEIYSVFPNNSDVARTSGPPDFSTPNVPTRVNSPSDVAIAERDLAGGNLAFAAAALGAFTANNSVINAINPKPNQTTLGEGPVTGTEVRFTVNLTTPLDLAAGHYFFVPQVEVTTAGGEFFWLSAPKPIVPPGTPFNPDLQSWIRNENLAPDWLRIGTDIVDGNPVTTFNAAFSLVGTIPEPASIGILGSALSVMALAGLRRRRS